MKRLTTASQILGYTTETPITGSLFKTCRGALQARYRDQSNDMEDILEGLC